MVKRTDKIIADEKNISNETKVSKITDYASKPPSNSINHTKETNFNDELIVSLADAYENKRARQVFEWETVRRKSFQQAA